MPQGCQLVETALDSLSVEETRALFFLPNDTILFPNDRLFCPTTSSRASEGKWDAIHGAQGRVQFQLASAVFKRRYLVHELLFPCSPPPPPRLQISRTYHSDLGRLVRRSRSGPLRAGTPPSHHYRGVGIPTVLVLIGAWDAVDLRSREALIPREEEFSEEDKPFQPRLLLQEITFAHSPHERVFQNWPTCRGIFCDDPPGLRIRYFSSVQCVRTAQSREAPLGAMVPVDASAFRRVPVAVRFIALGWELGQSRQPLLWTHRQYLRLGARPLEVGFGCGWRLLPT